MGARTISTKLAVEGEAEYKKSIAACNSELSTLKSSLAKTESEFRGNQNSMEALTAKGSALSSMYEGQKNKVSTLEAALKNAQNAQEQYSSRVATAKDKVGNIRRYGPALYRCISDHTSQSDWTPDAAVSLWTKIADPSEEWPAWAAPRGSYDAYKLGDKVSHNGARWTCTQTDEAGNNVWEPGVYGWEVAEA